MYICRERDVHIIIEHFSEEPLDEHAPDASAACTWGGTGVGTGVEQGMERGWKRGGTGVEQVLEHGRSRATPYPARGVSGFWNLHFICRIQNPNMPLVAAIFYLARTTLGQSWLATN